ncbi:hypothetical protein TNCV_3823911 [Trichonephila clavipes]|nr:hypothetical protein TNCV_3823911 [Trichonephila clavipes]
MWHELCDMLRCLVGTTAPRQLTAQFRNEKVSNHGSIPITIDCNVVTVIVFEEGFHQPIKCTKQKQRSAFDQVSEFDRGRIVAYRDCGLYFREIASRVGPDVWSIASNSVHHFT